MIANVNDNSFGFGEGEMQAAMLHNALRFLLVALEAYDAMPTEEWWQNVRYARNLAQRTMHSLGTGE